MFQDFTLALVVLILLAAAQHQDGKLIARLLSSQEYALSIIFGFNSALLSTVVAEAVPPAVLRHPLSQSHMVVWTVAVLLSALCGFYFGSRSHFARMGQSWMKARHGSNVVPLKTGATDESVDDNEAFNLAMAAILSSAAIGGVAAVAAYGAIVLIGSLLHFAAGILFAVAVFAGAVLFLVIFCRFLLRLLSDGSAGKEALLNFAKKGSKEKG